MLQKTFYHTTDLKIILKSFSKYHHIAGFDRRYKANIHAARLKVKWLKMAQYTVGLLTNLVVMRKENKC